MKLVGATLYIIFNETNYSRVVSAEPPDSEPRRLRAESRLLISAVHTGFNTNRHVFSAAPSVSRGPLTQNKLNYNYVSSAADCLYFWLWYFNQLNAAYQT